MSGTEAEGATQQSLSPARPDTALLSAGELVDGTFEITRKIGAGGMGEVYEAFDQRLRRRVALKISKLDGAGRLASEAQTLAALAHPAIIRIFHGGVYRDRDYFVMELIDGRSLEDHLQQHDMLPIEACLDLIDSITEAVDYLHRNRLVHRDLKPANVMIGPNGRVVLLDFGIVMEERAAGDVDEIVGTVHYLAPEALRGDLEVGDAHLMDLYAVGVLGYQLLTKQVPFDDESLVGVAHQHLERVAPRPSILRGDVPPRLDHLIAALLSKDPAERPSSMAVVLGQLRAIRRWCREQPTTLPPTSVLIVDDDLEMLALLAACVSQASPTTVIDVATSVSDAVSRLRSQAYEAIFLDLQLGGGSGVELLVEKNALGLSRDARLVVVSAHDQPANRQLVSRLGVDAFISKNIGMLELEDAVTDQLVRDRPTRSEPLDRPRGRSPSRRP